VVLVHGKAAYDQGMFEHGPLEQACLIMARPATAIDEHSFETL